MPLEKGNMLVEIKISLSRHIPYIKKVNVYERMKIKAKLDKKPIQNLILNYLLRL